MFKKLFTFLVMMILGGQAFASVNNSSSNVSLGGTMTDTKYCIYTIATNQISCNSTGGGGSSQWTTTNTNDVYLPSNGNVGIGTSFTSGGDALSIMNGNVGIGTWGAIAPEQIVSGGSVPDINLPSFSLATAHAGDVNNDGNNLYFTPFGTSRGAIPAEQMMALTSGNTLASSSALPIFNIGSSSTGGVTLNSNTTYYFELEMYLSGLSGSSGSFSLTFATTGTIGSIGYQCHSDKSAVVNTATATQEITYVNQASATVISPSNTTTTGAAFCTGIIRMTSTGTLTPEISESQTGTPTVAANSYFKIYPEGTNTTTTIGNIV